MFWLLRLTLVHKEYDSLRPAASQIIAVPVIVVLAFAAGISAWELCHVARAGW